MKKTLKIAVAGVGVGVVSLAGAGLASAHTPGDSERQDEIQDRVAEILGVDVTDLGDALDQAREEYKDAKMDERLDQAVADGAITQEEADEIRDWLDARPEVLDDLKGHGPRHGKGGEGLEERLATMVEDGTITQADADAVIAWSESRPEAMSELKPDRGEDEGRRGRGHHQGPGRDFQQRVDPGEGGEIGGFGGFRFQLPPDFEVPQGTPTVDDTTI